MSNTIAHSTHVHHHVPLMPVLAVIIAIAIAAAAMYAINLPETTTGTSTEAVNAPAVDRAAVAAPESPALRHALMTGGLDRAYVVNLHHLVEGTTLDAVSTQPCSGTSASPNHARAATGR